MVFKKLSRLPKRIYQDLKIIRLAKNWNEILSSKFTQSVLLTIKLRNGVVLDSPEEASLNFLFHEIWLDEVYAPKDYDIKSNNIVFDIGGNIGVFAFYAATKASNVKVYSYEPFPQNAKFFEQNLNKSRLNNVTLYNQAVAGESTQRKLHVHESWIKHSLTEDSLDSNSISVDCVSLNQALENFAECDLLKLDCEGSEYEILYASSTETLGKIKRIVGEYHNLDSEKKNGESMRKFLEENGYQIDIFQTLDDNSGFICAKRQ
ncbi:FkbM family methyltransferase [soil metagenome]